MGIQVLEAEDSDMYRIFEIASLAFGTHEPFFNVSWPNHLTESGRIQAAERCTKIKNTDPNTTYLKGVDGSTGKIVGMAKWNVYSNTIPEPEKEDGEKKTYWDDPEEQAYQEHLAQEMFKERNAAIMRTNGNVVSLDILAVDPACQRQGVGHALVEWGARKADEMGVEAVVESSVFGKGLYLKHGFVFIKDVVLPVPEKWADREKQKYAWLVRPKNP